MNVEEDVKDLLDRMEPLVRLFDPPGQLEEVTDLVQRDSTQTADTKEILLRPLAQLPHRCYIHRANTGDHAGWQTCFFHRPAVDLLR